MREIKFRAWDEQNKIMHYDFEFIRSGAENNDWIIFKSDKQKLSEGKVFDNPYFQQQLKIMQYTGLKDNNGVEIYEGDKIANDAGRICKVVWNEYCGQWDALPINRNGLPIKFETNNWKYLRVIGSIYEQQKGDTK